MNYFEVVPNELYNIILSYLDEKNICKMCIIKKPNYKLLLQFNFTDLYNKVMIAKKNDYNLNKYSIKNLYFDLLGFIIMYVDVYQYLKDIDKYFNEIHNILNYLYDIMNM